MRLSDVLGHENFRQMLNDMVEPSAKAPREKGPDAIPVRGYVVAGFWRRANHHYRRRRRRRALTPSEMAALPKE